MYISFLSKKLYMFGICTVVSKYLQTRYSKVESNLSCFYVHKLIPTITHKISIRLLYSIMKQQAKHCS